MMTEKNSSKESQTLTMMGMGAQMGMDTQMMAITEELLKITTESTDYDLDEDLELESNDLIKYEFNMIELPFFCRDTKIRDGIAKQYNFSKNKNQYMRVIPSADPRSISNKIPQEFDEKIFYGIMRLSKEQNSDVVITDYFTLAQAAGVPYSHKRRIEDSIQRLRRCVFELNNLFYDREKRGVSQKKEDFNILQDLQQYTLTEVLDLKDVAKKGEYQKYFRNSKIDCILVLTLSKRIYSNITNGGFLYFNQKNLLNIKNATARKLFALISKWQGWENKNQIRRSCRFIASRLSLSWEKTNITSSIRSIEAAAKELKTKGLIKDYCLTRKKPIADSIISFDFNDDEISRYNSRLAAINTGQENMVIDGETDDFIDDRQATIFEALELISEIQPIFDNLPAEHKTDDIKSILKRYENKGFDYVNSNVNYVLEQLEQKPGKFAAYLTDALSNDYAKDQRQKAEIKAQKEKERAEMIEKNRQEIEKEKAAEKAERERREKEAAEIYEKMSENEKADYCDKLRRKPYFEMFLKSLDNDISKAAISMIANDLRDKEKQERKKAAAAAFDAKNKDCKKSGIDSDVEKLFMEIPEIERSESPEKEVKAAIKEALQSGKDADYIRLCIYYAVLRNRKGFFKAFKAALEKDLVEKEEEDAETLTEEFQELIEEREEEARKEAEREKAFEEYKQLYKELKESSSAYYAQCEELEKKITAETLESVTEKEKEEREKEKERLEKIINDATEMYAKGEPLSNANYAERKRIESKAEKETAEIFKNMSEKEKKDRWLKLLDKFSESEYLSKEYWYLDEDQIDMEKLIDWTAIYLSEEYKEAAKNDPTNPIYKFDRYYEEERKVKKAEEEARNALKSIREKEEEEERQLKQKIQDAKEAAKNDPTTAICKHSTISNKLRQLKNRYNFRFLNDDEY